MVPPGAPGWTPPPKPGLIPLRPLTLGGILGASFQVLRRNPRPTFGFSLILNGIVGLVSLGVVGLVGYFAFSRAFTATAGNQDQLAAGAFAQTALSGLIPAVLTLVTAAVLQGIISLEVARGTVGERLKLGGLWRQAKGRIGALIGWSLLLVGAILVVIVVLSVLIGLLIGFGGAAGAVVGALLIVLAVAGLVVVGAWVGVRTALVPSALMLERLPLRAAIGRSWSLTTGYYWRTLGILLLVSVILSTASSIVTFPISFLLGLGATLINPNGDESAFVVVTVVAYVLTFIVSTVFGAITSIVQSAAAALIYIDLRMRKEGLDLDLTRFVEARQAGDASVADPFLRGTVATPAQPDGSPWA
ncbi:MAG: hypothetical protein ABJB03_05770 [Rhodoglobus sp.]